MSLKVEPPRMIEIEYMCKRVETKVDQDGGGGNIWTKGWTKSGKESWENQGVREEEFHQET